MKKQTAVDWYENRLIELDIDFGGHKNYWIERKKIRDQAKQMEKEQEADIFKEAQICAVKHDGVYFKYESIEDYYKSKEVEVESSDNSKINNSR